MTNNTHRARIRYLYTFYAQTFTVLLDWDFFHSLSLFLSLSTVHLFRVLQQHTLRALNACSNDIYLAFSWTHQWIIRHWALIHVSLYAMMMMSMVEREWEFLRGAYWYCAHCVCVHFGFNVIANKFSSQWTHSQSQHLMPYCQTIEPITQKWIRQLVSPVTLPLDDGFCLHTPPGRPYWDIKCLIMLEFTRKTISLDDFR